MEPDNLDINLPAAELRKQLRAALQDIEKYGVKWDTPKGKQWGGEMEVNIGPVKLRWHPETKEGYIDVKGEEGKSADQLKANFDKVRSILDPGDYGLYPGEADDASGNPVNRADVKHRKYRAWFRNDKFIELEPDENLRTLYKKENNPYKGSIEGFRMQVPDLSKFTQTQRNKYMAQITGAREWIDPITEKHMGWEGVDPTNPNNRCLLYTSPSPRDS